MIHVINQWDIHLVLTLQNLPGVGGIMHFFSFFGTEPFYFLLLPTVFWCLDRGVGARLAFILIASNGLNSLFKIAFHLPRPYWISQQVKALSFEGSYGLPSGHAMNSTALWGFIASRIKKRWAWTAASIFIFMISLSRLYLGVHFPTDVLAGWILGILVLWAFLSFERPALAWFKRLTLWQQIGLSFICSLVYLVLFMAILAVISPDPAIWGQVDLLSHLSKSNIPPFNPRNPEYAAAVAGMIFGLGVSISLSALHSREFKPEGTLIKRGGRLVIGLAGVLILAAVLKVLTPHGPLALVMFWRYFRYGLALFWVLYLAPRLFVKLNV